MWAIVLRFEKRKIIFVIVLIFIVNCDYFDIRFLELTSNLRGAIVNMYKKCLVLAILSIVIVIIVCWPFASMYLCMVLLHTGQRFDSATDAQQLQYHQLM